MTLCLHPFDDNWRNATEVIEDSIFVIVYLTLLFITLFPQDEAASYKVGWFILAVPFASILFSLLLMLRESCISIKESCRRRKQAKQIVDENNLSSIDLGLSTTNELRVKNLAPLEEPEAETPPMKGRRPSTSKFMT